MGWTLNSDRLTDASANTFIDAATNAIGDWGGNVGGLLGYLLDILGVVETIQALVAILGGSGDGRAATYADLTALNDHLEQDYLNYITDALGYPDPALRNVYADFNTNTADILAKYNALLEAIGEGGEIELPPLPPEGWGTQFATDVWNYGIAFPSWWQYPELEGTGTHLYMQTLAACWQFGTTGFRHPRNPDFSLVMAHPNTALYFTQEQYSDATPFIPDAIDWSLWTPGTSLADFLNAQESHYTWGIHLGPNEDTPGVCWAVAFDGATGYAWWRCNVEEWMLPFRSGQYQSTLTAQNVAPVWPGLDSVTLGEPVALAPGLTLTGPFDGLLFEITAVPPQVGHYTFDEAFSHMKIGAVAFVSDNGDIETAQNFSFTNHIITPKTMAHAEEAVIRTKIGVTGTVTPWTIDT